MRKQYFNKWLFLFIYGFCSIFSACLQAADINIHISDFGINQYWTSDMRVGDDFYIDPGSLDNSHNQVFGDMHRLNREILGDKAKSQILVPMPDDDVFETNNDLESRIYNDLKRTATDAIKNGNYDFEFQLVQHINTLGYGDPHRQEMVSTFTNAAYGAIARLVSDLEDKHSISMDATLGSNGTVGFVKAYDKFKPHTSKFKRLDFIDGRAFYKDMLPVVDMFGASKFNISNTRGDYPGNSPLAETTFKLYKMTQSGRYDPFKTEASIANHNTVKRLLKERPGISYVWVEPLDKSKWILFGGAHVLRMTDPDAKFKVRRFSLDHNNTIKSYDVPEAMSARDIRQLWGANDNTSRWKQKPTSLILSDKFRQIDNGNMISRHIASMIPGDAKVVVLGNDPATQKMKTWISAKVSPEKTHNINRTNSDTELFKRLNKINPDFTITFERDAPRSRLKNDFYVVGKDVFNSLRFATELYGGVVKDLGKLSSSEDKAYKVMQFVGDVETIVQAYDRDIETGIGGEFALIRSDTFYESAKLLTDKSLGLYFEAGNIDVPAYDSIKKAAWAITDAFREGRTLKVKEVTDLKKAAVGGLSYALGLSMTGNASGASAFEKVGLAAADIVDESSKRLGKYFAVNNEEYARGVEQIIQFHKDQQIRRINNNQEIQKIEDVFGKDTLNSMGISSARMNELNNSIIMEAHGLKGLGQLKQYSVRRYRGVNGFDKKVKKLVVERKNNDGSLTITTRTFVSGHHSFNGQIENVKLEGVDMKMQVSNPEKQIKKDNTGRLKTFKNQILNRKRKKGEKILN